MEQQPTSLAQWLRGKCDENKLSLRQAGTKAGLSHATIGDVIAGVKPSAETIRKLASAFGGDGNHGMVLEDRLLMLAGYRRQRLRSLPTLFLI